MTYKLFLDDYRSLSFLKEEGHIARLIQSEWIIARSCAEAIDTVTRNGVPLFVAFDHDLEDAHYDGNEGHERTGLTFARWLTDYIDSNGIKLDEKFDWCVHSMNPVGRDHIRRHMKQWYLTYYERNYR